MLMCSIPQHVAVGAFAALVTERRLECMFVQTLFNCNVMPPACS